MGRPPIELLQAMHYLRERLEDGPLPAADMLAHAPSDDRTLRRAKASLGVTSEKRGDGWWWCAPEEWPDDENEEEPDP